MADTLSELRTELRYRLGETSAQAWVDDELDACLNEGVKQVAIRAECNEYRAELVVETGVYVVSWPPLVVSDNYHLLGPNGSSIATHASHEVIPGRLKRVTWIRDDEADLTALATALATDGDGNTYDDHVEYPLTHASLSSLDSVRGSGQQTVSGTPQVYSLWGQAGRNKIVLYPKPQETGHLRIYFYGQPAPMSASGDLHGLPPGWDSLVLDYAEYKAKLRDKDPSWQAAKSEFEQNLMTYQKMFDRLSIDPPRIEADPMWSYTAGGWEDGWY